MNLHENKTLFRQAVQATAARMNIPEIYVEKDYWVVYALHAIFTHPIGKEAVFKGGTSLSKCFGLIDRFSEDIDLVVLRHASETDNQMKKKIGIISRVVSDVLPEITIEGITNKKGMLRKTAHTYSKEFNGDYGQVRDAIIIEAGWLGYYEPNIAQTVYAYIYEMMCATGQQILAQQYDLLPFELLALDPKRTLCEKIMSIVRFSYTSNAIENLNNKIRHFYDLHQLLQNKELAEFFESEDFESMLLRVAKDDLISFKNNNAWLQYHPIEAKVFAEVDNIWDSLKDAYSSDFKHLVFGELPKDAEIHKTLLSIKKRIALIDWKL